MKAHTHWLWQRITAIALLLLLFVGSAALFVMPISALLKCGKVIIFSIVSIILLALWHSNFGIQTICEDYIHNVKLRKYSLLFINGIFITSYLVGLLSLLCLMVL